MSEISDKLGSIKYKISNSVKNAISEYNTEKTNWENKLDSKENKN